MKKLGLILSILFLFGAVKSQAQLLGDPCPLPRFEKVYDGELLHQFHYVKINEDRMCSYMRSYAEGFEASRLVISRVMPIMLGPAWRQIVLAQMAAAGAKINNPVILTVIGFSAGAAVTMHIWIRKSLEECEQMNQEELRQAILLELERKYGLRRTGQETLTLE